MTWTATPGGLWCSSGNGNGANVAITATTEARDRPLVATAGPRRR